MKSINEKVKYANLAPKSTLTNTEWIIVRLALLVIMVVAGVLLTVHVNHYIGLFTGFGCVFAYVLLLGRRVKPMKF